ncbi:MAG: type-F conjugative transfer system pilin assembly protein TrbC [Candidatus Bathyarchaeia archaeon]
MLFRKNVLKYFCNVVAILLFSVSLLFAQDKSLEQDIENVKKKAKEINVPELKRNQEMQQEAKKAYEYSQSPEFKARVEKFKRDLNILLGREISPVERYYSDYRPKTGRLSDDERIYIFISSSMPEQTIRNYVREACHTGNNTYLILRGGIGGIRKLMPTVLWANEMLKKNPLCEGQCETYPVKILIDPFLFRKYSITRVPAVVYVRGLQNSEGLSEGLNSVKVDNFWVSYGDVSLQYHLKLIEEKSGVKILLE